MQKLSTEQYSLKIERKMGASETQKSLKRNNKAYYQFPTPKTLVTFTFKVMK